jgi:hypothetical protein
VSDEAPRQPPDEEIEEGVDPLDPLKRDPDEEELPGLDPVVSPIPPE